MNISKNWPELHRYLVNGPHVYCDGSTGTNRELYTQGTKVESRKFTTTQSFVKNTKVELILFNKCTDFLELSSPAKQVEP